MHSLPFWLFSYCDCAQNKFFRRAADVVHRTDPSYLILGF